MRIAIGQFHEPDHDLLTFAAQLGASGVVLNTPVFVPAFQECFIGEGNVDVVEAMRTLKSVGFDGFMIDDHVPLMVGDTGWGYRGRAYTTGYMAGLLNAVNKLA